MKAFVVFSILLQPIINSITGLSIRYAMPSVVGPLFYLLTFTVFFYKSFLYRPIAAIIILLLLIILFLIHLISGASSLTDAENYLKVIYPYYVFLAVSRIKFDLTEWKKIILAIKASIYFYAALVVASFLASYQIQEGKGYFGFIYAGNDLIALFLLGFAILYYFQTIGFKTRSWQLFFAYLLTLSKSIVFVLLATSAIAFRKQSIRTILFSVPLLIVGGLSFYLIFSRIFSSFFVDANGVADILYVYDVNFVLRVLTFGRSDYLTMALDNGAFEDFKWIMGNGINGAFNLTFGKGGVEMDIFDAVMYYGILGGAWALLFYYLPVLRSNINIGAKIFFVTLILYSILGGHFYNNPLVGFYYGLWLGIIKNDSFIKVHQRLAP